MMHARMRQCISGIVLLLLIGGCDDTSVDYFPLGESLWWQYRVERTIKGEHHEQKLILVNLPPRNLEEGTFYPQRRMDDRFEFYARDANGIYWVNEMNGERLQILAQPLAVNTKWEGQTRFFFLEMTGGFAPAFRERAQSRMVLEYTVESLEDTVVVAAGKFTNCMRVRATGSNFAGMKLKELFGIRFLKVEQTEWYAPGVGLIKRERNEFTTPADFSNKYVQELERVKHG